MKKKVFAVCIVATLAAVAALALARAQAPNVPLVDRIRVTGNDISVLDTTRTPVFNNLEELTAASTVILVGTAGANECRLSTDGSTITTDYYVTVEDVLKGGPLVGSTITVSLPGGKTGFTNPVTGQMLYAEVRAPWFKRMESGKRYYLFLTGFTPREEATSDPLLTYKPTGGPQGVFEDTGMAIKSHSGRLRDPIWQYHSMEIAAFRARLDLAIHSGGPVAPTPQ